MAPVTWRLPVMVTWPELSKVMRPAKKLRLPWPEGWR